jgi:calcium-dependent protein kinase
MGSQLVSKTEKEKIASLFRDQDKDGNGYLDQKELEAGFEKMGIILSKDEIDSLLSKVDTDGNGKIEYTEFVVAAAKQKDLLTEQKLKRAFAFFDVDNNGKIAATELRNVLSVGTGSEIDVESIIAEVD